MSSPKFLGFNIVYCFVKAINDLIFLGISVKDIKFANYSNARFKKSPRLYVYFFEAQYVQPVITSETIKSDS